MFIQLRPSAQSRYYYGEINHHEVIAHCYYENQNVYLLKCPEQGCTGPSYVGELRYCKDESLLKKPDLRGYRWFFPNQVDKIDVRQMHNRDFKSLLVKE